MIWYIFLRYTKSHVHTLCILSTGRSHPESPVHILCRCRVRAEELQQKVSKVSKLASRPAPFLGRSFALLLCCSLSGCCRPPFFVVLTLASTRPHHLGLPIYPSCAALSGELRPQVAQLRHSSPTHGRLAAACPRPAVRLGSLLA